MPSPNCLMVSAKFLNVSAVIVIFSMVSISLVIKVRLSEIRARLQKSTMRSVFFCFTFYFFLCGQVFGYDCVADTYEEVLSDKVTKSFLAGDKIYVKISCLQLPPGQYSLVVNWNKHNHGTVRTDTNRFVIKYRGDREVYFWMKVGKKGLLNRALSLSDYNTDLIGGWTTHSFLNGEPVAESAFTVN